MYNFRLAINYTCLPTERECVEPLRLDQIYAKCQENFRNINVTPPTKDLISKLITVLFDVERCFTFSHGERFYSYKGLVPKCQGNSEETIVIPERCTARRNENNELVVSYTTDYFINNEQIYYSVIYGHRITSLNVRGSCFPLRLHLSPTQSTIDGMIFIMENLKICKGILAVEPNVNDDNNEKWSKLQQQNIVEMRARHTNCKNILSFYSKNDYCSVCVEKERRSLKRQMANQTEECAKSKVGKLTITGNDDDEITTVEVPIHVENCSVQPLQQNSDSQELQLLEPTTIVDELIKTGQPDKFKLFTEMQNLNNSSGLDKRRRRWDPEFISLCISLYVRSPKAYEDLRNSQMLVLPTERLLRMYKNCIKQKPGINTENIQWMNKEALKQDLSKFGKRGGIIIDEMSIQDDLQIVRKGDAWSIVGGVDMGEVNNNISVITNKEKKVQLATHCLQFIFHGFCGFRWPIAYFGANPATTHQLYVNFWECLDVLDEHGFTVDYVMFDGATTNRSFMNMLLKDDPRSEKYTAQNIYDSDHQVYVIQDVKHVIKKLRNNIEASKREHKSSAGRYLVLNGKPVVWDHFEEAYQFNLQSGFRIHKKLTKEHLELTSASKMRNKLAEQVLDKDMLFLFKSYQATLDVPERLASTILLLEHTSILVDVFRDTRPISERTDTRLTQLAAVLSFFNKWEETIHQSKLYTASKHLFPQETRDDLNSCIVGFSSMCSSLLGTGNSITPAYLNSDIVENHFCQQRGTCNGLNTNPTLAQYGPSNTSICLGQVSVSSKSNSTTKASFFSATTPCALNKRRSVPSKAKGIRM